MPARQQKSSPGFAVSRDAATEADSSMEENVARKLVQPSGWGIRAQKGNSAYAVSRDASTEDEDAPAISRDAETVASEAPVPTKPEQWNFGGARTVPGMGSFTARRETPAPAAAPPAPAPAAPAAASPAGAPPSGIRFFSGNGGTVPVQAPVSKDEASGMQQHFFSAAAPVSAAPIRREPEYREEPPAPRPVTMEPARPVQPVAVPYAGNNGEEVTPQQNGRQSRPEQISYNSYAEAENESEHPVDREKHYIDYGHHVMIAEADFNQQMNAYHKHYADWKRRVWILPTVIVAVLIISVLIGAFVGPAWILLFVLLVVLAVVIMAVTGKLNWLKLMKKPKKVDFQMEAPELQSIHSVRIRLCSTNLSTPVEITIRNKMQIIGSSESECREPLKFRGISRRHISITCETRSGNSEYFVTDLKSSNGTKLNGAKLKPYEPYPIKFGDVITLAGLYEFRVSSDAQ